MFNSQMPDKTVGLEALTTPAWWSGEGEGAHHESDLHQIPARLFGFLHLWALPLENRALESAYLELAKERLARGTADRHSPSSKV